MAMSDLCFLYSAVLSIANDAGLRRSELVHLNQPESATSQLLPIHPGPAPWHYWSMPNFTVRRDKAQDADPLSDCIDAA